MNQKEKNKDFYDDFKLENLSLHGSNKNNSAL